ncbi:vitamin B12 ABC transporter permease BtuC [Enterovibrio norvegicus FF-454]|uniref:Vitamin B12 import system permease protein BtuC n=1 Tax=Enterovibrio norvegicus FF-454 TaxID=1185651 RepID=A0A1E5C9D0_9GAMM|nr:vitamin B12 ABC transporter permease BtuC [Enterovibrio norvegicus]OEE62134.1 vitamin B12 ABC transporter permease BtuC [Enterovibrio norvegicus FF-454]
MHLLQLVQRRTRRWHTALITAVALLIVCSLLSLAAGEIWIFPFHVDSPLAQQLLMELRVPRVIAAILIGASLAVSGAVLQVLLGNPLAEPGVLGISGGASLALVLVMFFFPALATQYGLMSAAMLGALSFTGVLVWLARKRTMSTARLLLIGVALGILSGAIVTWAFYFSSDLNLRQLLYWLMGSLSGVHWAQLTLAVVVVPAVLWLCTQGHNLDLMMLGEAPAKQLGLNIQTLRWQLILMVSVLVGASVAMAGVIGFVGLVVPHFLRLWLGTENRYLLPLSALAGASLLLVADTIGRMAIAEAELPVGAVTTSLGAPLFIWMLLRRA